MSKIYHSIKELVGNTPIVKLHKFCEFFKLSAAILAKLEFFNPGGSVKDRIALCMIEEAEKSGTLKQGGILIEPTSGNTGIGLAEIATAKGYRLIVIMPDSMSEERKKLMAAYGAEIVLTPGHLGMKGAIDKAEQLSSQIPDSLIIGQFINPANPLAHYQGTGPEIWQDTDGNADFFIAGVGTGGTITGVGQYLKSQKPDIKIIAVEPASSPVLSGGKPGPHKIQGIGAGFIPPILDQAIIDEIIKVKNEDAVKIARILSKTEGILTGFSGGAALWAAVQVALENNNANIVVILPDGGDRYLSTCLYEH